MKKSTSLGTTLALALALAAGCGPPAGDSSLPEAMNDNEKRLVREAFEDLRDPVEVISFTEEDCRTCQRAELLIDGIAALDERVKRSRLRLDTDKEAAREYGIFMAPATVIRKDGDTGIRFYGTPSGHEFKPFVDTIRRVSRNEPSVTVQTAKALETLRVPVTMKIFTSPT